MYVSSRTVDVRCVLIIFRDASISPRSRWQIDLLPRGTPPLLIRTVIEDALKCMVKCFINIFWIFRVDIVHLNTFLDVKCLFSTDRRTVSNSVKYYMFPYFIQQYCSFTLDQNFTTRFTVAQWKSAKKIVKS